VQKQSTSESAERARPRRKLSSINATRDHLPPHNLTGSEEEEIEEFIDDSQRFSFADKMICPNESSRSEQIFVRIETIVAKGAVARKNMHPSLVDNDWFKPERQSEVKLEVST